MKHQEFNERINISFKHKSKDVAGSETEMWSDLGTFWAKIRFKREMTYKSGEIRKSYKVFEIEMRYNNRIKKGMRVECKGVFYYVSKFINVTKNSIKIEAIQPS